MNLKEQIAARAKELNFAIDETNNIGEFTLMARNEEIDLFEDKAQYILAKDEDAIDLMEFDAALESQKMNMFYVTWLPSRRAYVMIRADQDQVVAEWAELPKHGAIIKKAEKLGLA